MAGWAWVTQLRIQEAADSQRIMPESRLRVRLTP
jgi:hypothetical protein